MNAYIQYMDHSIHGEDEVNKYVLSDTCALFRREKEIKVKYIHFNLLFIAHFPWMNGFVSIFEGHTKLHSKIFPTPNFFIRNCSAILNCVSLLCLTRSERIIHNFQCRRSIYCWMLISALNILVDIVSFFFLRHYFLASKIIIIKGTHVGGFWGKKHHYSTYFVSGKFH